MVLITVAHRKEVPINSLMKPNNLNLSQVATAYNVFLSKVNSQNLRNQGHKCR